MSQTIEQTVRHRIKAIRERNGQTQRQLAQRMRDAGSTVHFSTIAKIESGKRSIPADSALALAWGLHCAPVHLLAPHVDHDQVSVLPKVTAQSVDLRAWIRGQHPIAGVDEIAYGLEVPASEAARNVRTAITPVLDLAERMQTATYDAKRVAQLGGLLITYLTDVLGIEPAVTASVEGVHNVTHPELHKEEQ